MSFLSMIQQAAAGGVGGGCGGGKIPVVCIIQRAASVVSCDHRDHSLGTTDNMFSCVFS